MSFVGFADFCSKTDSALCFKTLALFAFHFYRNGSKRFNAVQKFRLHLWSPHQAALARKLLRKNGEYLLDHTTEDGVLCYEPFARRYHVVVGARKGVRAANERVNDEHSVKTS